MKDKFPFTDYDFWAYLTSGFVLMGVMDYGFTGSQYLLSAKWTVPQGMFVTAIAYIMGHVIASLSNTLIGYKMIRHILGDPTDNLLHNHILTWWQRTFFGEYYRPLSDKIRQKIWDKVLQQYGQCETQDVAQFAHQYGINNPSTKQRIDSFLNLYGFCRNLTVVGIISLIILCTNTPESSNFLSHSYWKLLCGFLSIGMFWRYLKFLRAYNAELLNAYALS